MSSRPQAGETRLVAPSRLSPWAWRSLLVLLALAWFGAFALKPMAFFGLGVNHFGVWFLDAFAILASNDAAARGLIPTRPTRSIFSTGRMCIRAGGSICIRWG